jgi:hypothetical protein
VLGKRLRGATSSGCKLREELNGVAAMAIAAAHTRARRRGHVLNRRARHWGGVRVRHGKDPVSAWAGRGQVRRGG